MGAAGTIGEFELPYIEVTEAVDIALMVVERYNGKIDLDTLAKELKLQKNGGGFRMKLASLKGYGLLETGEGRGKFNATELAQKIHLTKDAALKDQRKGMAFLVYPLFRELFNHFGGKVPDGEALSNILGSITKRPPMEVAKVEPRILRYYTDAAQYLIRVPRGQAEDQQAQIANQTNPEPEGETKVSQLMVHTKKPSGGLDEIIMGDVRIYLRPDLEDVEVAKGLLSVYEKRLRKNESSNPRD